MKKVALLEEKSTLNVIYNVSKNYFTEEISSYLVQVKKLSYTEKPNYNQLRDIFTKGLTKLGIKDTWKLALPTGRVASPKVSEVEKTVMDHFIYISYKLSWMISQLALFNHTIEIAPL